MSGNGTNRRGRERGPGPFRGACAVLLLLLPLLAPAVVQARPERPNFVVINIDDLGYGDIAPFGSTRNGTPELQKMAAEGLRLTSFYAGASVCSPSRAALLTGSYPKRVGLATGSSKSVLFPLDPHGLNPEELTLAEILREAGYATGCFGKWHLGDQPEFLPLNHGFDSFLGTPYSNDMWPPHPNADRWEPPPPPLPIIRDDRVVDIVADMQGQAELCRIFTDAAVDFIRSHRGEPFFVYLPHAFIHHPRAARERFFTGPDLPPEWDEDRMIRQKRYALEARTRAQIAEVDWSVGRILGTLRELGLEKRTLVVFISDNGGTTGSVNAPLRGGKGQIYEGGIRVPAIVWWPGVVPAGASSGELVTTMDLLPTVARLAGSAPPGDRIIDGKDVTPILEGVPGAVSPHESFYYFNKNRLSAVRCGPWKLYENGRLYNLDEDVGETRDLSDARPEVVRRLRARLMEGRADLDDPASCRPVGRQADPQPLLVDGAPG